MEPSKENNFLLEYIRHPVTRKKIGVAVSTSIDNEVRYGYSLANLKAGDEFNQELGREIAIGRILNQRKPQRVVHKLAYPTVEKLVYKALKYFKGSTLPEGTEPVSHH